MRFLEALRTPPFFNKNPPKNRYTRKQSTHFSIAHLRPKFKKKFFLKNPSTTQFGMPKKMTPNSQAKFKPPILAIPIFNHFLTIKRYYGNKYLVLSLNRIMKLYSNMYDYVIYA